MFKQTNKRTSMIRKKKKKREKVREREREREREKGGYLHA